VQPATPSIEEPEIQMKPATPENQEQESQPTQPEETHS